MRCFKTSYTSFNTPNLISLMFKNRLFPSQHFPCRIPHFLQHHPNRIFGQQYPNFFVPSSHMLSTHGVKISMPLCPPPPYMCPCQLNVLQHANATHTSNTTPQPNPKSFSPASTKLCQLQLLILFPTNIPSSSHVTCSLLTL